MRNVWRNTDNQIWSTQNGQHEYYFAEVKEIDLIQKNLTLLSPMPYGAKLIKFPSNSTLEINYQPCGKRDDYKGVCGKRFQISNCLLLDCKIIKPVIIQSNDEAEVMVLAIIGYEGIEIDENNSD